MSVIVFILLFTWAEAHSPMQRFGRVKCDYVANVTQYETECFFLGSLTEVPFYRIVSQSVRWLKQHDPKMALISEEKCCFHTHIHMSWNMAEDLLSPVSCRTVCGIILIIPRSVLHTRTQSRCGHSS